MSIIIASLPRGVAPRLLSVLLAAFTMMVFSATPTTANENGPLLHRSVSQQSASAQHQNGYAYASWQINQIGRFYDRIDQDVTILQKAPASFWALTWTWSNVNYGGYVGLQTDGNRFDGTVGEMAIFSVWNAVDGLGSSCQQLDGPDSIFSCRIPFTIQPGRNYSYQLQKFVVIDTAQQVQAADIRIFWSASIMDGTTEYPIGTIQVANSDDTLGSVRNFSDYFGTAVPCDSVPTSRAQFGIPQFNSDVSDVQFSSQAIGDCSGGSVTLGASTVPSVEITLGGSGLPSCGYPVDTVTLPSDGTVISSAISTEFGQSYRLQVDGTYRYDVGENGEFADAQYREDDNDIWSIRYNSVVINGVRATAENTAYNPDHSYDFYADGNGQPLTFRMYDESDGYDDNTGTLDIQIYLIDDPSCPPPVDENDLDGDGLPNAIETIYLGTDPTNPDTDGDGLLDPWEVNPQYYDPSLGFRDVPGAGFNLDDDPEIEVTRDQVFGPYADGSRSGANNDGRPRSTPYTNLVNRPDPLRKDIYLEIDWQDCKEGDCPEHPLLGIVADTDPTHHAPSIAGLEKVIEHFADDPRIENPDGTRGINLHILVDEKMRHTPNCDRGTSAVRDTNFGTRDQREAAAWQSIRRAKEKVYRYGWSGHSTQEFGNCDMPSYSEIRNQGYGEEPLPDYDYSPFGEANIAGRDILISLGPLWICPDSNTFNGIKVCKRGDKFLPSEELIAAGILAPFGGLASCLFVDCRVKSPGIFPATVRNREGLEISFERPIHKVLNLSEQDGITALWSRSLARLLGYSLGISERSDIGNAPLNLDGDLELDPYTWPETIYFAPPENDGIPQAQSVFDYPLSTSQLTQVSAANVNEIMMADEDQDGVEDAIDNCPNVSNANQSNIDDDDFGDVCDNDADNDELEFTEDGDPLPFDTDNDGTPNVNDDDDDNDTVLDALDNCSVQPNEDQANVDGDQQGDVCDPDADNDGKNNIIEIFFTGSDPLKADSLPEVVGEGNTCTDGVDNDLDGDVDAADTGCLDTDGDSATDALDNCPSVPNFGWLDSDGDGLGDACDETPNPINTEPTVNIVGPRAFAEGQLIEISAAATPVEFGDLTVGWDFNDDGIFGTYGESATLDASRLDGPGTQTVRVRVSDNWDVVVFEEIEIQIANVPPAILSLDYGFSITGTALFTATFSDPGILDAHSVVWAWGDGTDTEAAVPYHSNLIVASHDYPNSTSYEVTLTLTDDDGGSTSQTITVQPSPQQLLGDVNCSENVDAVDALFILQYNVGLRNDGGTCPLGNPSEELNAAAGNVNGTDGTNAVDALFVLQCEVGLTNVFCPGQGVAATASNPIASATVDVEALTEENAILLQLSSADVAATTMEIRYNQNKSQLRSCSAVAGGLCNEVSPGVVKVSLASATGLPSNQPLAEMLFDGNSPEVSTTTVVTLVDTLGRDIPYTLGAGQPKYENRIFVPIMSQ